MAFVIKALGEMQVHCVVVGIWPNDNLLTFYNGELNGRIDDIHLEWSGADLRCVIAAGARALNIEFDDALTTALLLTRSGALVCCSAFSRRSAVTRAASGRSSAEDDWLARSCSRAHVRRSGDTTGALRGVHSCVHRGSWELAATQTTRRQRLSAERSCAHS